MHFEVAIFGYIHNITEFQCWQVPQKNYSRNLLGPTDSSVMPASNCKHKPHPKIKPYTCKPQKQKDPNALRTSAKAPQTACENLTLSDWLKVIDYHDTNICEVMILN